MRNITNTFENVSNRNITNSILTNSLKATLPLELTDDGLPRFGVGLAIRNYE